MNYIKTLGKGKKAKPMNFDKDDSRVLLYTGIEQKSRVYFSFAEIEQILNHFKDKDWFPLSNDQTGKKIKENGLGAFLQKHLNKPPKNASHIAAYLFYSKNLDVRYDNRFIELKFI